MAEIGVVVYPGAQQSAVLGLTDLLCLASGFARTREKSERAPLRITHWRPDGNDGVPSRVFDSHPDAPSEPLSALILPPTLEDPDGVNVAPSLSAWLRDQHAQGVVMGAVCAGA